MIAIRKVLVPTDFSPAASPAMARGIDLARQFGAELHLLHVALLPDITPMYPLFHVTSDVGPLYRQVHEDALRRLERLRDEVELSDRVHAEVSHSGAVAPAITRYAREHGIDVIAIGTHGWRGVRRLLLGSVAEEVLRDAGCPVWTFRADDEAQPRRPGRILAAVDLSPHSRDILAFARSLAAVYHARLEVCHVVPHNEMPRFYESGHGDELLSRFPEIEGAVLGELETLVRDVGGEDCELGTKVLHGAPWQEILGRAAAERSDLVVIGARGFGELSTVALGSTAQRVVREAECPVVSVRYDRGPAELALREARASATAG